VAERIRFRVEARPARPGGTVLDIQIALNGIVVKKWLGPHILTGSGSVAEEVELEIPPGDLRVAASAFNESDLRSTEAVWERPMQGFGHLVQHRTLYVLGIGIRTYKNPRFNLTFADSDVILVAKALGIEEGELQKISNRVTEWSNKRTLETLQAVRQYDVPARVQVKTLLNEQATRTAVLNALSELAKVAQPKDAVIIYYAGHGVSDQSHYYMLPWDMGLGGTPGSLDSRALKAFHGTLIADDDITGVLAELNVKYGALILDSCFSGQALEGADLLGPINPQGLAGWAYEKGISLLAASEPTEPSFEIKKLGASVLTYALIREGLQQRKADAQPLDGRIELEEWLRYAVSRVPSLVREATASKVQTESIQKARFAPSRAPRKETLVLAAAEKEP
jgi:hypothetical protein